jgi:hypothetical protein
LRKSEATCFRRTGTEFIQSLGDLTDGLEIVQPLTSNYACTVLQIQLQIEATAEGYDSTVGIMHDSREGSSVFAFGLMEPERPKVDRRILEFVKAHKFHAADYLVRADGVCWLNPAMARRVAQVVCGVVV